MSSFEEFAPALTAAKRRQITIVAVVDITDAEKLLNAWATLEVDSNQSCLVSLHRVGGAFHLRCAVDAALTRLETGMAKTGSFGTEVAFRLANSTNIARVVEMNSATQESTKVAAVFVESPLGDADADAAAAAAAAMATKIAAFEAAARECGTLVAAADIAALTDSDTDLRAALVKEFKLSEKEVQCFALEDCIVNKISIKDL